jgi:hypothetical protein
MLGVDREHRIRKLAQAIWEQEGRPEGHAERHWLTAEKVVEADEHAQPEVSIAEIASATTAATILAPTWAASIPSI